MTLFSEFVQRYGRRTAAIVGYLAKGWKTDRIAKQFHISKASVATYKANLTRGAYYPYVDVNQDKGIFFV